MAGFDNAVLDSARWARSVYVKRCVTLGAKCQRWRQVYPEVYPGWARKISKNILTIAVSPSKTQVEWGCSLWLSSNSKSGPHGYGQTHQKLEPWLHCWNLFHQLSSSIFFSISCDYADRRQNPSSEWTSSGKIVTADCAKPLWDGIKVKTSNS